MKKRGRPTKLNAELTRKICELLRDGISITATCDALGVSESKYFEWLKKGGGGRTTVRQISGGIYVREGIREIALVR